MTEIKQCAVTEGAWVGGGSFFRQQSQGKSQGELFQVLL